jgi:hypothetical protein
MSKINSKWYSHLKGEKDKKDFEGYIKNSVNLLDRLTDIVNQKIIELECPSTEDYSTASWGFKQADRIGQLRAYREILKLTDLRKGVRPDDK